MEAIAVDKLIEKAHFHSDVALAIAEAFDVTLQAGNFVTVPLLDARFAAFEAKLEGRFTVLEKSIESAKVWAVALYAGLIIALFGALTVDHHWLVNREDQTIAQVEARSDQRFQQVDSRFQQMDSHFQQIDTHFQQVDSHLQQIDSHLQQIDSHLQQIDAHSKQVDSHLQEIDTHLQRLDTESTKIRALPAAPGRQRSP